MKYLDKIMYDIIEKYGMPREHVSCPGCGQVYGHHNTKVCKNCEECSLCCMCKTPNLVKAEQFIKENIL